jgi:hypothetical protein
VGARFSAFLQAGLGAHPAFYKIGIGSFAGVRRPGRGVNHLTLSNAEVKERVELYLYSPCVFMVGYRVNLTDTDPGINLLRHHCFLYDTSCIRSEQSSYSDRQDVLNSFCINL